MIRYDGLMREATAQDYSDRIRRVEDHIRENLDEPLPLDRLAAIACFSPFHFHRIFRGIAGESVQEHVRRLRLERAARRLKYGNPLIVDVAIEAGYESHEAFTRAFRDLFGVAPSQWRGEHAVEPAGTPAVDVRLIRTEAFRVMHVRHDGPYESIGETWRTLSAQVGARGLFGPWTRAVGIVYDDPEITPAGKLRYDAAFMVNRDATATLPAGDYICTEHRGPYNRLHLTYAALCGTWLRKNAREIGAGPALEFYLNRPDQCEPEDLLTRICLPLD